jgi:hypothetical protein
MKSTIGFVPDIIEWRIVLCGYLSAYSDWFDLPFEDKLPRAAALLPWTSTLGELVNGINTSQMPISSSCGFRSSIVSSVSLQKHTRQGEYSDASSHFTLYSQWYTKHQILDPLDSMCLYNRSLVPLAACCQVS